MNRDTPSKEELHQLAEAGYTYARLADKYNRSKRFIITLSKLYPEIEEKLRANGRKRTAGQKLFGGQR